MGNIEKKLKLRKIFNSRYNIEKNNFDLTQIEADDCILLISQKECSHADLKNLKLLKNNIQDHHLQSIFSFNFSSLENLNLYNNNITDKGLQFLIKSVGNHIKIISIEKNQLTRNVFMPILLQCQKMQRFDIRTNHINFCHDYPTFYKQSMSFIDPIESKLKYININGNYIGGKGCKILCKLKMFELEHLQIASCFVGDEGISYLSKWALQKLVKIDLNYNYIGIEGLQKFVKFNNLKKLKYLHLNSNKISFFNFQMVIPTKWKQFQSSTFIHSVIYGTFNVNGHFDRIEQILKRKFIY